MQDSTPDTIRAWQQGDERAIHATFDAYYPQAVRLAVLSGLAQEAAEDCAQEAFSLAFERRRQLRDPQAFPLWFYRVVTHHIFDCLRRQSKGREISLEMATEALEDSEAPASEQPDAAAISAEERAQLWQRVQGLAPQYRVPIVLRYYAGFSFRDIAQLTGKREGTIRVIIHRALQQLRLNIEESSSFQSVVAPSLPIISTSSH